MPVCFAVLDAAAHGQCRALTANQLLFFEVLIVVLSCLTILHTSKVGIGTLEALVIRKLVQGKLLQVVEEPIVFFRKSLGLVEVLELCSLQCFFDDDLFEFFIFFDEGLELRILRS